MVVYYNLIHRCESHVTLIKPPQTNLTIATKLTQLVRLMMSENGWIGKCKATNVPHDLSAAHTRKKNGSTHTHTHTQWQSVALATNYSKKSQF